MTTRATNEQHKRLQDFAKRIIALDDVKGQGAEERRTVTLTQVIRWAEVALGEKSEGS